jgi:hypothetical protein
MVATNFDGPPYETALGRGRRRVGEAKSKMAGSQKGERDKGEKSDSADAVRDTIDRCVGYASKISIGRRSTKPLDTGNYASTTTIWRFDFGRGRNGASLSSLKTAEEDFESVS